MHFPLECSSNFRMFSKIILFPDYLSFPSTDRLTRYQRRMCCPAIVRCLCEPRRYRRTLYCTCGRSCVCECTTRTRDKLRRWSSGINWRRKPRSFDRTILLSASSRTDCSARTTTYRRPTWIPNPRDRRRNPCRSVLCKTGRSNDTRCKTHRIHCRSGLRKFRMHIVVSSCRCCDTNLAGTLKN